MKISRNNVGVISFVMIFLIAISAIFVSNARTQAQQKKDDKVSLSWETKKHQIKSVDSKLIVEIPDSLSSQDWIVGVVPTQESEPETMVAGVASWKQGTNGIEFINSIENLTDNSIQLSEGKINLTQANEFGSLESPKSMVLLLRLKAGTEVSLWQKGNTLVAKTVNGSEILSPNTQFGTMGPSMRKVTGPSSLLVELQSRRISQMFQKRNAGGNKSQ
jgi:hypothetical protein